MKMRENKLLPSIVLICACCGKGWYQAHKLWKALQDQQMYYNLVVAQPKKCVQILEKYGLTVKDAVNKPYVYIEDLCIPAIDLNDKAYFENIVKCLKNTNAKEAKLEEKDSN